MNALHSFAGALRAEGRRILDQVVATYDNPDSVDYRNALAAFVDGRAAYWSTGHHHNAKAAVLLSLLNGGDSFSGALRAAGFWRDDAHRVSSGLDCMVPLNDLAARQLADAYSERGHLREPDELLARQTKRVERRRA
jgi:hypothetical protein